MCWGLRSGRCIRKYGRCSKGGRRGVGRRSSGCDERILGGRWGEIACPAGNSIAETKFVDPAVEITTAARGADLELELLLVTALEVVYVPTWLPSTKIRKTFPLRVTAR